MITWDVSPEIFTVTLPLIGDLTIRWYGVLFAASFLIGFKIMESFFNKENKSQDDLNDLLWYMLIGTIVGARLGHCLFYNPEYYLSNPIEILKTWKGGLASHGAAIGIVTSIMMYSKKKKDQSFLWVMDRVVITVALAGFFIRTGNLMNSEIIGTVTNVPWAFKFVNAITTNPELPRHPAQLYEALSYLTIFIVLFKKYKSSWKTLGEGFLFGLFLVLIFTSRFIIEFFKENQSSFEQGMILNMGQLLSIPLIIWGLYLLFQQNKTQKKIK